MTIICLRTKNDENEKFNSLSSYINYNFNGNDYDYCYLVYKYKCYGILSINTKHLCADCEGPKTETIIRSFACALWKDTLYFDWMGKI